MPFWSGSAHSQRCERRRLRKHLTIVVVPDNGGRAARRLLALFEARRFLQMDFDVVSGARDVSNEAPDREPPQIAMSQSRELTAVGIEVRRSEVARISIQNRTQLAGELLFELLCGTWCLHALSLARSCGHGRIKRFRVGAFGS